MPYEIKKLRSLTSSFIPLFYDFQVFLILLEYTCSHVQSKLFN